MSVLVRVVVHAAYKIFPDIYYYYIIAPITPVGSICGCMIRQGDICEEFDLFTD